MFSYIFCRIGTNVVTYPNGVIKCVVQQCQANEEKVNGQCQCKAGYERKNGVCVKKPQDLCAELAGKPLGVSVNFDYGPRGAGALGRMIGKPTTGCYPGGCAVSGTVEGCWSAGGGGSGCSVTGASFTGSKCDDKADPNQGCPEGSSPSAYAVGVCVPNESKCPAGSSESKYAAGVCIPDESPCPKGQSPSKYAAGVCVPDSSDNADGTNETGNKAKCPKGEVPSKYAVGVCIPADNVITGNTACKDGKCTTTKPDGTTDEKPQEEFCKLNPEVSICKTGSFGGSCGSGFSCEGDAIQCAIAREQHKQNCKLFDESTPSPDYKRAIDGTDDKSADALRKSAEQISVSQLDTNGMGWGRACPADLSFDVAGKSFAIPFSKVCPILNVMALAALGLTLLSCVLWVVGKKD
ncbi:virulence factor TspB C-terminal domain-related protein [Acidovorax sp. SUPP2825]|uniref:virulence factor TspB C-terminal domain-related protein n=1 Tax=Acidovorax sp. SUPP2825 TaxID=2920879 RepID=UPI0023DE3BD0|nr:virulence factor TspB C-terminal domain-related protein [Acidovorax sp. SUPP2825]GKS96152.1 hypothetical protein AVAK2825_16475 [Acidovorax sp. SUPP2825]